MGGTDVTEVTRRCVATAWSAQVLTRLAMEPVVLAGKHRVSDNDFRSLREHNNCAEHNEWRSGVNPASLSKS
jgi:hypothetical protein